MTILSLETSAAVASVALLRDGKVLAEAACDASKKHAETVLPAIDALLRGAGCAMAGLDAFAVDVGPGSFTGVRIGVCLANGFALAMAKPVIPVDALRALYEPYRGGSGLYCALIDARNGNAYAARYRDGRCVEAPRAVELAAYGAGLDGARCIGDVPALCAPLELPSAANVGLAGLHPFGRRGRAGEPAVSQAVAGGAQWRGRGDDDAADPPHAPRGHPARV